MGQIPLYEAVRDRNIPTRELLSEACRYTAGELQALQREGLIASGMVYGSVPRGDHSITSDIDVLVRWKNIEAIQRLRDLTERVADQFRGSVLDFCLIFDEFAPTYFHRGGYSFFNHIRANPQDKLIIGANPIQGILFPKGIIEYDNAEQIGFYLDGTLRKFLDFRSKNDERYYDFLKVARERYKHIIREAVQLARDCTLPVENRRIVDDNKGLERYFIQDFGGYDEILSMLEQLVKADIAFGNFIVKSQAQGTEPVTEESYNIELRKLEEMFPVFTDFTIKVCRILYKRYFENSS